MGEELVEQPFARLIEQNLLGAYRHDGFWQPMDTFKDKQRLDELDLRGMAPWQVWKRPPANEEQSRLTAPRRRLTAV